VAAAPRTGAMGARLSRISLRPEVWLPWLTVLGFGAYVVSWLGREVFYAAFGVSPEIVGVHYPSLLIPAAIVGVFVALTLLAVIAFVVPLFVITSSRRAGQWQMKIGGLILLSVLAAAAIVGAIFGESGKEGAVAILTVPWIMGALFLIHGFGSWFRRSLHRRAVRSRLRRLRRQVTSPEEALSAYHAEQRSQRRRQATRRAERARVRREARPAGLVILLWLATILYMMLGAYLTDAATRAAYNAINGKTDIFVGADRPANVLLNVQVRTVQVEAIEPHFHSLQRAQLLYLGTNSGGHVLYDRTARQAVVIPSGSVALRFDSSYG
jgi:hypothetical protein